MWEKSKFDIDEEENKVHKNLSRLIHTLQHFPSKRSGLDTSSLWNLVEELESFNPDRKTKSMQFTQTTERKTYRKKYLNLRISSGNEKTGFATRSSEVNQKFKNGKPGHKFNEKSSNNNCNQFKEKDFQKPKSKNAYTCGTNKGKHFSNNIGIKTNNKTLKNDEVRGKNLEKNNAIRRNNVQTNNQPKSENVISQNKSKLNSLKDPEKKMDKSVNLRDKRSKINHNSKERNYCHKLTIENKVAAVRDETKSNKPNRSQMVNFKCKSHQCTPKSNKALQQIILDNNQSSMDRSSVVKKLTNYWNNLLNNESEQYSSTTVSSGGSCQNVQILEHLTQRAFNKSETQSENSSSTLKSRHLSESNINIMKRVDDLHSKRFVDAEKNSRCEPLNQIKDPITDFVAANPSDKMTNEDYIQISEDKELRNLNEIDQFLLINKTDAIEVLQNTLNTLKTFPCCNIQLFTKKILYVMVGLSMLNPQHDMFLNKLEVHADKMIQEITQMKQDLNNENRSKTSDMTNKLKDDVPDGHILSALNNNLGIDMYYISKDEKEESVFTSTQIQKTSSNTLCCKVDGSINTIDHLVTDNCKITDSGSSLALVTSRINLNKVENALNLFLMWREIRWCSSSYDYEDIVFASHDKLPFKSFTIIYEENIIFEEENSDEDYFTYNDAENECETNIGIYRSAAATIEKYIDRVIDILENYYPDSPEVLIRMIYQALVSILIWWVIVKEVFVK